MHVLEWLAVAWAVATILGIGILALWSRYARRSGQLETSGGTDGVSLEAAGLLSFASRDLDVEREFAAALMALQALAAQHRVELQMLVQPRLAIRTDPYALRHILIETLTQAIGRATGGGVLLSATWLGGRVQTTITDDGAPANPDVVAAALRAVEQSIALQGGTIEIACNVQRGNVVTLRLPGPGEPASTVAEDASIEEPGIRRAGGETVVRTGVKPGAA